MTTSAIPSLVDALFTLATAALPTVTVYDGYGISENPGDFLMVGVDDPDQEDAANSAASEQSWANIGHFVRDESGDITLAALSWNGNGDQKQARDGVFAITAALENLMRTDPTLGLGPTIRTEFGSRHALTQQQGDGGASALLIFSIHFDARI